MNNEKVLCFKRELLDDIGAFQGISFDLPGYLVDVTTPANLFYVERSLAETDETLKQLIPYVLILLEQPKSTTKILHYRRGKKGGEARLHDKWSVGIGGHIAITDTPSSAISNGYNSGMRRELIEEIGTDYGSGGMVPAVALINDDSDAVGRVHFGVVHVLVVKDENILSTCADIADPAFVTMGTALQSIEAYEGWSRLCLQNIKRIASQDV